MTARVNRRLRRAMEAGAAAATLTLALASAAAAHTAVIGSQHALTLTPDRLTGQLTSATADCASNRSISLYRADTTGAIASTTTDMQGAWSRPADTLSPGVYYAVAAAMTLKLAGHKHTCESARSNTLTFAADADGDGYSPTAGDCADNDASRHPGAADNTRNGIDDDCDGRIDEDYVVAVICDATSSGLFDPQTGTWTCVPLQTYECPIEPDARDAASAEWNAYLAVDPSMLDPALIAELTYPPDYYIACFGF